MGKVIKNLALSLFPGADLLGKGFERAGYCVVRGPDILWGQDVRGFSLVGHAFEGIFGGSPCPDFSKARRTAPTGEGVELISHFTRLVTEGQPDWWLLENVPQVPSVNVSGYTVQRFNLNAKECGLRQNRLRCFQFGYRPGSQPLVIARGLAIASLSRCCMATEGKHKHRRTFADFCELQGLPRDFSLPGLPIATRYKLVGNGVPVPMAQIIAEAIRQRDEVPSTSIRLCICECGRAVNGGRTMATPACRKRMQRKRDSAGVTVPGPVTIDASQLLCFET